MRGAVSGRVAAATPVRLACASRSLGRLALVAPTCLPAAASLSIYTILSRYTLTMLRALMAAFSAAERPISAIFQTLV